MIIKLLTKLRKFSKNLLHNNLEKVTNGHDTEIPKERYISLEKKDKKVLMI